MLELIPWLTTPRLLVCSPFVDVLHSVVSALHCFRDDYYSYAFRLVVYVVVSDRLAIAFVNVLDCCAMKSSTLHDDLRGIPLLLIVDPLSSPFPP